MRARHTDPLFHRIARRVLPVLRRRRAAAVHRERDQQRSACSARPTPRRTSRTASTTSSFTATPTRSIPRARAPRRRPHYQLDVAAGETQVVRLRLTTRSAGASPRAVRPTSTPSSRSRLAEADEFYAAITPPAVRADPIAPTSCARRWPACSGPSSTSTTTSTAGSTSTARRSRCRRPSAARVRNSDWGHMFNDDIISMPDKWEYPWYAAWDLAFHMIPLGMVDPDFAKQQLELMLRNDYLHPNGQMPAYEWNFGDVNPPVHAWATLQLYLIDKERRGDDGDIEFLKYAFSKLLRQLHLVGQPQGPHRRQRLRGRLPRPRQHRRLRPLRAAAHRRLPRAGRRHRLDGVLQPADAAHRGRTGRCTSRCTRSSSRSSSSTRCSSPARWTASATPGRDVGRGGRLLLRRAAPARRQRHAAEGALDGRAAAAGRGRRLRGRHRRETADVPRARAHGS